MKRRKKEEDEDGGDGLLYPHLRALPLLPDAGATSEA